MDQVGVKAPGRPKIMTFFPATFSTTFTFLGGKPRSNSKDGTLSPIAMGAIFTFLLFSLWEDGNIRMFEYS